MRNPHGYGVIFGDGHVVGEKEHDTFQCGYCNKHVRLGAFQRPCDVGGYDDKLDAPICAECVEKKRSGPLIPFEKLIEQLEKKFRVSQWS
jgi:hypothetical protein